MTIIGGRYQVNRLLGKGGMGEVYYGVDLQDNTPVAIKALKPDVVERDPSILERFRREGQALKELDHPNIVKMLAMVQDGDQHYLVMEYVAGGSLYDLLKRTGRLPIEQVLPIALDLSDALTRAHRLEIIHRDIKPANVLLAEDGTPRLTDFGAAHIQKLDAITREGGIIGTVSYLSPEACRGEKLDPRADIWAFGVMLFEMLTGRRPFDRREKMATAIAIIKEPLPDLVALWPDAPPQIVDLIYRMLEKDRERRIGSMRQVGAELEAIIQRTGSGVKEAIDLFYRMLEEDRDKPIGGMKLVGARLASTGTPPAESRQSLPTRQANIQPAPPASPANTASPSASTRNLILLSGIITAVLVIVVIVLLLVL
ncbi:MAG: serine/threonine protein kinase [Anaerolineae bacterium]|nr:serine/threonine protein kinase [Anaerolineae bacterium]